MKILTLFSIVFINSYAYSQSTELELEKYCRKMKLVCWQQKISAKNSDTFYFCNVVRKICKDIFNCEIVIRESMEHTKIHRIKRQIRMPSPTPRTVSSTTRLNVPQHKPIKNPPNSLSEVPTKTRNQNVPDDEPMSERITFEEIDYEDLPWNYDYDYETDGLGQRTISDTNVPSCRRECTLRRVILEEDEREESKCVLTKYARNSKRVLGRFPIVWC